MIDAHNFKVFAKNIEIALQKYESDSSKNLLEVQRTQIKTLINLENKFRRELIKHPWGTGVYKKFISFILNDKCNILAARPYFRERQSTFTKYISGALKKGVHRTIFKYKINYSFISFVVKACKWPKNGKIMELSRQIEKLRDELTEQNIPLAISQARMFYACTPRSHLSWMDLVQIHCGGLLIAIDKFVPPDTSDMTDDESLQAYRKFRAVAIGRMISDRIESASETVVHFYPADKKKLYRANKLLRAFKGQIDYEVLVQKVNEGIELESQKTNVRELQDLLATASCVSGDTSVDGEMETTIERYSTPEDQDKNLSLENMQAINVMKSNLSELPVFQQKIFKMYGISL